MLVVLADGSTRPIAEIVAGDQVLTYDLGYEKVAARPVVEIYSVDSNHLYTVNNALKATGGERVLTTGGWTVLSQLAESDQLHINGTMVAVRNLDYARLEVKTYNLQVADTHNFYVATPEGDLYLVHNTGGGGK